METEDTQITENVRDAVLEILSVHERIQDLSKYNQREFMIAAKNMPPEVVKYLKTMQIPSEVKKRKAPAPLTPKKPRATPKPRQEHNETRDSENDFIIWYYQNLKEPAQRYINRLNNNPGTVGGTNDSSRLIFMASIPYEAPWTLEENLNKQMSAINLNDKEALEQALHRHASSYKKRHAAVEDSARDIFAQHMELGAYVSSVHTHFIATKVSTWAKVSMMFGFNEKTLQKVKRAYEFVRMYPLIMYSGVSLYELNRWLPSLEGFFKSNLHEAYFFSGLAHVHDFTERYEREKKTPPHPAEAFIFNGQKWPTHDDNAAARKDIAVQKAQHDAAEEEKARDSRNAELLDPEEGGDFDDRESLTLIDASDMSDDSSPQAPPPTKDPPPQQGPPTQDSRKPARI